MSERERVMEAALERIRDMKTLGGGVDADPRDVAHYALAEVRALPASNTETELAEAKARLALIAELVDDALPAEYAGNVYVDAEHYRSIQRIARGDEARS
jgi:hypothetical protein